MYKGLESQKFWMINLRVSTCTDGGYLLILETGSIKTIERGIWNEWMFFITDGRDNIDFEQHYEQTVDKNSHDDWQHKGDYDVSMWRTCI